MSTGTVEKTAIIEAVFTVCVPVELLEGVMGAVESINGAHFAGGFQEYITRGKKPQFTLSLTNAPLCVALVDCDVDREAALETMQNLQAAMPGKIRLVAVCENPDAALLMRLIRMRCNDIFTKPIPVGDLTSALLRFQAAANPDYVAPTRGGEAIALVGSKGGVGTSTLAVHLATHLVKTHKKRVLLVDQKHQMGHLALYLGIKQPKYHFSELLQNADRLDASLLEGLITRHSVGLDVIASPQSCTPRYEGRAEIAEPVITFLRQRYDFVLLDMELECSGWMEALVTSCDEVDMVCTPDVGSLRDATRHIEYLSLTENFTSKLRVIVNRAGSELAISKEDVERATRGQVSVEVPVNHIELVKAVNSGEPIPVTAKGKFTQALSKWAHTLAAGEANELVQTPSKKRKSLWR